MECQVLRCQVPDEQWLFALVELSQSPSCCDGLTWSEELYFRALGIHLIYDIGGFMSLSRVAIQSAATFFHRFYMRHSFFEYNLREMVPTILFMSTKIEESYKKMEDCVDHFLRYEHESDPSIKAGSSDATKLRESVLRNEDVAIKAIEYDLTLEHPHEFVGQGISIILKPNTLQPIEYPDFVYTTHRIQDPLLRLALEHVSQSFYTPICLLYPPLLIAAACVLTASQSLGINLQECFEATCRARAHLALRDDEDEEGQVEDEDDDPSVIKLNISHWYQVFQATEEAVQGAANVLSDHLRMVSEQLKSRGQPVLVKKRDEERPVAPSLHERILPTSKGGATPLSLPDASVDTTTTKEDEEKAKVASSQAQEDTLRTHDSDRPATDEDQKAMDLDNGDD